MRPGKLLSLIGFLALSGAVSGALIAAKPACAQRRGGSGPGWHGAGIVRGGSGFSRARYVSPFGFGYGYEPSDSGLAYGYDSQPAYFLQQPVVFVQAPAPPAVRTPWHPVVTEYKWPAPAPVSAPSTTPEPEPQTLGIVLKDGSTLSAVSVFATDDGLHYVDPDARHMHISMSEVDRAATLKLNRARNLDLYLPAAQ